MTMPNPIPPTLREIQTEAKPGVGKWVALSVVVAILTVGVGVGLFFLPSLVGGTEQQGDTQQFSQTPPTVVKATASITDSKKVNVTGSVSDFDSTSYMTQYELTDKNRNTLSVGETGNTSISISVSRVETQYRLRVRLVEKSDPSTPASDWSDATTFGVDGVNNSTNPDEVANDAWKSTRWATETTGLTKDDLSQALQLAFNAKPIQPQESYQCLALNEGDVKPGELLSPEPDRQLARMSLVFIITSFDSSSQTGTVQYGWC